MLANQTAPNGAAGIAFMTSSGELLFLRRGAGGDHAGEWCFPGGKIEDGETAEQAAVREAREEIGEYATGSLIFLDRAMSPDGIDFTTFKQDVTAPFTPTLDAEHTEYVWAPLDGPPEPLHPGIRTLITADFTTDWGASDEGFALDRAAVQNRTYDADGRMHVAQTNISKAVINPYLGREIPGWKALGLKPDKVYRLYRDPEELARAAPTFNNLPLLSEHVPVTAAAPRQDLVVGSTGSTAVFEAPYLKNSIAVWTQDAINKVESKVQHELSSAYRYRAEMTPGNIAGQAYDGVMRDIVGNHVCLVKEGRAGSDVVVGDSAIPTNLQELVDMTKIVAFSPRAALVQGALLMALRPKIAQDAKVDFATLLGKVTNKNFKDSKPGILAGLRTQLMGKLATGMAMDASIDDVAKLLDTLQEVEVADPDPATAAVAAPEAGAGEKKEGEDADPLAKVKAFLEGKCDPAVIAQLDGLMAADTDPPIPAPGAAAPVADPKAAPGAAAPFKGKPPAQDNKDGPLMQPPGIKDAIDKPAMDAAIGAAVETERKRAKELREAENAVRPYVGELIAQDTAEGVYKAAFDILGVKVDGVHPSAFPTILGLQPKPGERKPAAPLAMDAAGVQSYAERFPNASRIGNV